MTTPVTAALVLFVIPVAWSAAASLVRKIARKDQPVLSDTGEKLVLAAMLLPVMAGLAVLVAPPVTRLSPMPMVSGAFDDFASVATGPLVHTAKAGPDLIAWAAWALLTLYALGAAIALGRLGWTHTRLRRIVKAATSVGDGVVHTDAAVPAFAWGRRQVVLPASLRSLTQDQIGLVLAHERAHQKRHDPLWFLTLSVVEAVFWFNPLIARQGRACRLAAELACDADVIGQTKTAPRTYAQTLIAALKLTAAASLTCVPAVGEQDAYRLRVGQIMKPATPPKIARWLLAGLLLIVPVTVAQFAFAQGTTPALATIVPDAKVVPDGKTAPDAKVVPDKAAAFAIPVDGQTGEGYGMRKDPFTGKQEFHKGLDFIAATGTPVRASAAGTVTLAANWPAGYGEIVDIDHGNGMKTRYTHLSRTDVKVGDQVAAGQVIGAVGSTGRSTGPHLHFEIWQDGKAVNPAPLLGLYQN